MGPWLFFPSASVSWNLFMWLEQNIWKIDEAVQRSIYDILKGEKLTKQVSHVSKRFSKTLVLCTLRHGARETKPRSLQNMSQYLNTCETCQVYFPLLNSQGNAYYLLGLHHCSLHQEVPVIIDSQETTPTNKLLDCMIRLYFSLKFIITLPRNDNEANRPFVTHCDHKHHIISPDKASIFWGKIVNKKKR